MDYNQFKQWLLDLKWTPERAVQWQEFFNKASRLLIYGRGGHFQFETWPKLPEYNDLKPADCANVQNGTSGTTAMVGNNSTANPGTTNTTVANPVTTRTTVANPVTTRTTVANPVTTSTTVGNNSTGNRVTTTTRRYNSAVRQDTWILLTLIPIVMKVIFA